MLVDKLEITPSAFMFELDPAAVHAAVEEGAIVVDGRAPEAHDAGHVPGSVNVPLAGGGFPGRVRSAVGAGVPAIVLGGSDGESLAMAWAMEREGRGPVRGILPGGIEAYAAAGLDLATQHSVLADRVAEDLALGGAVLVDAREDDDWVRGHVPGSLHIPLRSVAAAAALLPTAPVVVACTDGSRAATAASILRRLGHANVWRVAGAGVPSLLRRRLDLGGI
jgi:rhodanese-related sulfurtransferase